MKKTTQIFNKQMEIWQAKKNSTRNKIYVFIIWTNIKKAFDISKNLSEKGIKSAIYSCHTLKPFDYLGLRKIFKKFKRIIVIEDHSKIGGLASIVKQHAFESEFKGKIISFSLQDKFLNCFGSQQDLLNLHGINDKNFINL